MGLFSKNKNQINPTQLVKQQRQVEATQVDQQFKQGISALRDFISPGSLEFQSDHFKVGTRFGRSFYVYGYPRQIYTGWLSPIINMDEVLDLSMFVYPVDSQVVLENLKKKVGQLEANIQINAEKGRVRDPGLQAAISDAEELRDKLQVGEERFFRFALYFTIYADSLEELSFVQHKVESTFGQQLIYSKPATVQQEQGMNSCLPQGVDQLQVKRNMNTGAISTSFPFSSADLTQDDGILYGVNMHNNGLVIFDRFSLENANMVVFAKAGGGKSFAVKLEALRSLMMGTEVIIIDPENEYKKLCEAVGGSYIRLSLSSKTHINPFDLPHTVDQEEADNALRANLITLHGLMRLMMGGQLDPSMEADLDQALIDTYAKAGITNDPLTHTAQPPTIIDLYDTLVSMPGSGPQLAQLLRKYTAGTFAGIFSQQSNVTMDNKFTVFNVRDLEDELRPVAMYIILSYIWNKVRSDQRKRYLIVDEAWLLMKYEDSANFLFSLAKRARKYYLGLTTISQDVEDMLSSRMGRAIVSNSSMQLLLKQGPNAVELVSNTFKLTSEESKRLVSFPVGQGLFFAGQNHIHIRIDASPTETELVSTTPGRVAQLQMDPAQPQPEADVPQDIFDVPAAPLSGTDATIPPPSYPQASAQPVEAPVAAPPAPDLTAGDGTTLNLH
jgi:conjugal transfer ATP-binding protein TraC